MQEQTSSSSWFSAPSRLLSKAINAASYGVQCTWKAASAAPVAALAFASQITCVTGEDWWCFDVPGESQPYLLLCSDENGALVTISKALESGAKVIGEHFYICSETYYTQFKEYGSSVFNWPVCELKFNGALNTMVDNIISQNAPHGVWTDGTVLIVTALSMVGLAAAVGVTTCAIIRCRKNRGSPLSATEDNRVANTQDQEDGAGEHLDGCTTIRGYQANAAATTQSRSPSPTRTSVADV